MIEQIPELGSVALFAGIVVLGVWLVVTQRKLQRARLACARLQVRCHEAETRATSLDSALCDVRHEHGVLQQAMSAQAARLEEREHISAHIDSDLRASTAKLLEQAHTSFLRRAGESFAHHQQQHRERAHFDGEKRASAMAAMVQPLQDSLTRYEKDLTDMRAEQNSARGAISAQIRDLAKASQDVRLEARRLTTALKAGPRTRGCWGEAQLRNVVELAGMSAHVDFTEQKTHGDEGARKQPDMIVRLPGERLIIIDSKVSMNAYLDAVEAGDDASYKHNIARHTEHIRAHIKSLSAKDYASTIGADLYSRLDFVIMFLPAESLFAAAIDHRPALFQEAFEKQVLIATPTTLIAILKAISLGWRHESAHRNGEHIARLGKELYDSLCTMGDNLAGLGRALEGSVRKYNQTIGSYEARVVTRAQKFSDLELPGIHQPLPKPRTVEVQPRTLTGSGSQAG